MSGYNDPCANDPTHGPAVVGIGPSPGKWVCMPCFEQSLKISGDNLRKIAQQISREEGFE